MAPLEGPAYGMLCVLYRAVVGSELLGGVEVGDGNPDVPSAPEAKLSRAGLQLAGSSRFGAPPSRVFSAAPPGT